MQTDTLIGIVGAAVLVAVMVGVFAYEYNNAPEGDDGGGGDEDQQARMEAFNQTYPTLDAMGDIDRDGTPNWQDDDIDGDDTPNEEDDMIHVTFDLGQNAPAHTDITGTGAYSSGEEFTLERGFSSYEVTASHDLGTTTLNRVQVDAGDAGTCTTGDEGDCSFADSPDAVEGDYNVRVRQTAANPNALPVTITVSIMYG